MKSPQHLKYSQKSNFSFVLNGNRKQCVVQNQFSYFSIKAYIVGAQKNRLNETVLLNIQTYMFKLTDKKIIAVLLSINLFTTPKVNLYEQKVEKELTNVMDCNTSSPVAVTAILIFCFES